MGSTRLGEYDFKKQTFEFKLSAPSSGNIINIPLEEGSRILTWGSLKGSYDKVQFPIDEENAEQFRKKYHTIYFSVEGKIYDITRSQSNYYAFKKVQLAYHITGSKIEFYTDSLLKNKIHEVSIINKAPTKG